MSRSLYSRVKKWCIHKEKPSTLVTRDFLKLIKDLHILKYEEHVHVMRKNVRKEDHKKDHPVV